MDTHGSQGETQKYFSVDNQAGTMEKAVRIAEVERTFLDSGG